jgi:hypothetical protein
LVLSKGRSLTKNPAAGYGEAIAFKIIDAIMEGKSFRWISTRPGMPGITTIYRWMAQFPDFKEAVENARAISAMTFEDKALEVAEDLTNERGEDWTNAQLRARELALKQWGWSAERRDPGRFGSRMAPSTVVPIQINTTLDLGGGSTAKLTPYEMHAQIASDAVEEAPRKLDLRPPAPEKVKPGHKTAMGIRMTNTARADVKRNKDSGSSK